MKQNYTHEYHKWRTAVLNKYGSCCVRCGGYEQVHAHHIKPWKDFPELRFNLENGEVLCIKCHMKEHPFMKKYGVPNAPKKTIYEIMLRRNGVSEILKPKDVLKFERKERRRSKNEYRKKMRRLRRAERLRNWGRRAYKDYRFSEDNPNPNWTS